MLGIGLEHSTLICISSSTSIYDARTLQSRATQRSPRIPLSAPPTTKTRRRQFATPTVLSSTFDGRETAAETLRTLIFRNSTVHDPLIHSIKFMVLRAGSWESIYDAMRMHKKNISIFYVYFRVA